LSFELDRLYELLPAAVRIRDTERGGPLRDLLAVIAREVGVLEEDLDQLYDDQFIETCAPWAVPYIGDLIGYQPINTGAGSTGRSPRAEVANTIGYRRRKGTLAVLEALAHDVTGWDAHAVEFFRLLATTQYLNHLRPANLRTPRVDDWEALERLDGPFDRIAHTLDVRSIPKRRGRHNIPNIGLFVWRLAAYPLTLAPAAKDSARRYRFNPLGIDAPLFHHPLPETEMTQLSTRRNVPEPLSRRVLDAYLADYYGSGKSFLIRAKGEEVPIEQVVVCDLSDRPDGTWGSVPDTRYAVDPVLGRFTIPKNMGANPDLRTVHHYGFPMDLGGGEYDRKSSLDPTISLVTEAPSAPSSLQPTLEDLSVGGAAQVSTNDVYAGALSLSADAGARLEFRAADGFRPVLMLPGEMVIDGSDGSEITLNGLVLAGAGVRITGKPRLVRLLHCTIVPGVQPALTVETDTVIVMIDHGIVGGLRSVEGADIRLSNSIVDSGAREGVAYAALDGLGPGAPLMADGVTIVGKVHAAGMPLVSNSLLHAGLGPGDETAWPAPVVSERRQQGYVRFSYVPLEGLVPRRYRCRPSGADEAARLSPAFTSLRYGHPAYGQLGRRCPSEISSGADDGSEMGAYHDLYQPQRKGSLGVRLDEYLRFGLQAGIIRVT